MSINLNKPKTIVFHPGIGKTATSAIQKVGLALSTENPDQACFSPFGIIGGAHNSLASNHPLFNDDVFKEEWKKTLDFASKRNASTIISSEFLIRDRPIHIKKLIDDAKKSGLDVQVVFAVRNYSDYLISAFLQAVKVNWGIKAGESVFEFCERELASIRMNRLVDHWSRHTGDEKVFLMNYDSDKKEFIKCFFSCFSLSIDESFSSEIINSSIPLLASEIIREFDAVCGRESNRKSFIEYVSTLSFDKEKERIFKERISSEIVRQAFNHDLKVLNSRYKWLLK